MADKEFLLITKARELLVYTRAATKPINSDVPLGDVQKVLHKIAGLDDLGKMREVCIVTASSLRKRRKDGFSKHSFRDFGQDMRDLTKSILRGVHAANDVMFAEEPEKRLKLIDDVLSDTALLLDYIVTCKEAGIISTKTAGIWSGKAMDVKRMAAAWRKSSSQRAEAILREKQEAADRHTAEIVAKVAAETVRKALAEERAEVF